MVHGRETREHIEAASAALFGRGDLQVLPAQILRESTQDVPTVGLPAETSVVDAFLAAGLSDSSPPRGARSKRAGRTSTTNGFPTARRLCRLTERCTAGGYCCGAVSGPSLWWMSLAEAQVGAVQVREHVTSPREVAP